MPAQPGRDVGSPWVTHGRGLGVFGALAVEAFTLFQEKKELRTRPRITKSGDDKTRREDLVVPRSKK